MSKKSKPLKIMKVKDLEDGSKYPEINPILPQPPFMLIGYGSVRSGKTNSLINMMRRSDMYGTDYWEDVLVISNTAGNDPKMYKFMGDAFKLEDHYENSPYFNYNNFKACLSSNKDLGYKIAR